MSHNYTKKIISSAVLLTVFLLPFLLPVSANAQTSSGLSNWLSSIFDWQNSITNNLSGLFETRKNNVKSNSVERNQLLDWRQGVVQINAPSSSASLSYNSTAINMPSTSSPIFIPLNIFQEKKSSITVELLTAENSLTANAGDLADFIKNGNASGDDMTAAEDALDQANIDINNAGNAIADFENYSPDVASSSMASSSDMVNLQVPQSYLDAAITAIRTARNSLESAITLADDTLQ